MEVSDQLYAPATLPRWQNTSVHLVGGWVEFWVFRRGEKFSFSCRKWNPGSSNLQPGHYSTCTLLLKPQTGGSKRGRFTNCNALSNFWLHSNGAVPMKSYKLLQQPFRSSRTDESREQRYGPAGWSSTTQVTTPALSKMNHLEELSRSRPCSLLSMLHSSRVPLKTQLNQQDSFPKQDIYSKPRKIPSPKQRGRILKSREVFTLCHAICLHTGVCLSRYSL